MYKRCARDVPLGHSVLFCCGGDAGVNGDMRSSMSSFLYSWKYIHAHDVSIGTSYKVKDVIILAQAQRLENLKLAALIFQVAFSVPLGFQTTLYAVAAKGTRSGIAVTTLWREISVKTITYLFSQITNLPPYYSVVSE